MTELKLWIWDQKRFEKSRGLFGISISCNHETFILTGIYLRILSEIRVPNYRKGEKGRE